LGDLNKTRTIPLQPNPDNIEKGDYLSATLAVMATKGIEFQSGYQISVHSTIPINAGISSSSALIVAWIRFILKATGQVATDIDIARWAHESEVVFFGEPGGIMDHYSIALRSLRIIEPATEGTKTLGQPKIPLLLAHSGLPKSTLGVLSLAKERALLALARVQAIEPDFNYLEAQLSDINRFKQHLSNELFPYFEAAIENYELTKKAIELLEKPPNTLLTQLCTLINRHQYYLDNAIQNTPDLMKIQLKASLKAGALAAKVIGSGGGGCFLVVAESHKQAKVSQAILDAGGRFVQPIRLTD
jgi:galactokinase